MERAWMINIEQLISLPREDIVPISFHFRYYLRNLQHYRVNYKVTNKGIKFQGGEDNVDESKKRFVYRLNEICIEKL